MGISSLLFYFLKISVETVFEAVFIVSGKIFQILGPRFLRDSNPHSIVLRLKDC